MKMLNIILVTLFTLGLFILTDKANKISKKITKKVRVKNQYRKVNGQFSKIYIKPKKVRKVKKGIVNKVKVFKKEKRRIPINYMGQVIGQIVL